MLAIPLHYWVTLRNGYVLSSSPTCPIKKNKKSGRVSYIGFTFDEGWPKKMNTGRLFYPPKAKKKKTYGIKHQHEKKLSNGRKTDNIIKQQR